MIVLHLWKDMLSRSKASAERRTPKRCPLQLTRITYQHWMALFYRAGAKAAEAGPKRAPEDLIRMVLKRLSFRVSSGSVSPALGAALQGYPADRCLHSKSGNSHLQIDKP